MANQMHQVTITPSLVPNLTTDARYLIENSGKNIVYYAKHPVADATPSNNNGYRLLPGAIAYIRNTSTERFWVWTTGSDLTSSVSYDTIP